MGKQSKSVQVNAKKEQRKLTQRRRAALEERLRAPRALQDCGAGFLQPALLRVGDLEISFERTLSKPDLAACFDILEENMKEQYEVNPWGWDPKMKRAELANDEARFVVVRDDDRVVAFAHFRFEVDDDDAPERAVLYVRELQVAEARRGSGIGRRVMGLLQLVGAKLELDCVLLTVFESNKGALAFYEAKLKYGLDRDDPSLFGRRGSAPFLLRAQTQPLGGGHVNLNSGNGARRRDGGAFLAADGGDPPRATIRVQRRVRRPVPLVDRVDRRPAAPGAAPRA